MDTVDGDLPLAEDDSPGRDTSIAERVASTLSSRETSWESGSFRYPWPMAYPYPASAVVGADRWRADRARGTRRRPCARRHLTPEQRLAATRRSHPAAKRLPGADTLRMTGSAS
jgi:hypothetical protein